jgi:hypothetical protein
MTLKVGGTKCSTLILLKPRYVKLPDMSLRDLYLHVSIFPTDLGSILRYTMLLKALLQTR